MEAAQRATVRVRCHGRRIAAGCSSPSRTVTRTSRLRTQLVAQPRMERSIAARHGLGASQRLARMQPGARLHPLADGQALVTRERGARMLRRERPGRALQLLLRLDLQAGLAGVRERRLETLRARVVLEPLAVPIEPAFVLED